MATELAKAYVQIIPSAKGISGSISEALGGEADSAGKSSGKSLAASLGGTLKKSLVGLGIGKMISDSIGGASEFETSMAKVSTLYTGNNFSGLQTDILNMSSAYGLGATTLAEAAYSAESAGVSMENLTGMLEGSAKLAVAGFTDIDTALSATAKTMNAYGDAAGSIEDIQKVLIQTQNLGITTVGELGASLANVTPTAAAAGVGFDQVGAALAQMTANGVPTAQATTQLRAAMTELSKKGTAADKSFRKAAAGTKYAGMSFQQAVSSGANLGDVFGLMQSYADKSGKSMVDLWGSVEAGNAAMTIAADLDKFNGNLKEMGTDIDVVGDAYGKMADTFGTSLNKLKESAKNFMTTLFQGGDIAASFDQMLSNVGDIGAKLGDWLQKALTGLGENLPDMIESALRFGEGVLDYLANVDWISLGTTLVNGLIGALGTLGTHLIEWVSSGISDLTSGKVDFAEIGRSILGGVTSIINTAGDWLKTLFDAAVKAVCGEDGIDFSGIGNSILDGVKSILDEGGKFLADLFGFGVTAAEGDDMGYSGIGTKILDGVKTVLDSGGKFLGDLFKSGADAAKAEPWPSVGEAIKTSINLVLNGGRFLSSIFSAGAELIKGVNWKSVGEHAEKLIVAGLDGAKTLVNTFVSASNRLISAIGWESIGESITSLLNSGFKAATRLIDAVSGAATDLISGIEWKKIGQKASGLLNAGFDGAIEIVNALSKAGSDLITSIEWNTIGSDISGLLDAGLSGAGQALEDAFSAAHTFITEGINWKQAGQDIQTGLGDVWKGLTGFVGGLLEGGGETLKGTGKLIGTGAEAGAKALSFGDVSQETFQDLPCLLLLRRAQQVIVVDYLLHFRQLFNQLRVNGGINLARQHLFFFYHIILVF